MSDLIVQLGILILVSSLLAVLVKFVKQPSLIGYILAGLLFSALGVSFAENQHFLEIMSSLGIVLLLYVAGLELKMKEFAKGVKDTLIVGESKDAIMIALGFCIGIFLFKFGIIESIYLAVALALSSTIIIIKTLGERRELATPHGRILVGNMIIQDLIVMSVLAVFTSLALGGSPGIEIIKTVGKGILIFFILYFVGIFIAKRVFDKISDSIELIFVFGLSWVFAAILLSHYLGFSIEIGAFFAGMSVANLPFAFEIRDKIRGVQDLGLLLFFFTIGASLVISAEIFLSWQFLFLVLFVLLGTFFISLAIGATARLDTKKNFMIAVMPTQVSEFSIILVAIGLKLGQISEYLFSMVVGTAVVTILISSAYLKNINMIYAKLNRVVKFFEWREIIPPSEASKLKDHVVIFGYGTLGRKVAENYKRKKKVVIEWDLKKLKQAEKDGCIALYGDGGDSNIWEEASIKDAALVVNTISTNMDDDLHLGRWLKKNKVNIVAIANTHFHEEVEPIYKTGYDLVLYHDEIEWNHLKEYLGRRDVRRRIGKKK